MSAAEAGTATVSANGFGRSGAARGDLALNALRFAELELDSRLGHDAPVLSPGACGAGPPMIVRMQAAE